MHASNDIKLRVSDWPNFGKTADMSLDRRLFESDERLGAWCRERFGPGALRQSGDDRWSYERKSFAPRAVRRLLGLVLNKSYR